MIDPVRSPRQGEAPARFLQRGRFRLHYIDEGRGPLVVCVHGNPTWGYFFRELVQGLRHSHRVIVPDHIGCGLSDKPRAGEYGFRLADRIDDLEALLGHVAPTGPVSLVVHDWGGMIGLGWAVRHPDRLHRLVAMNTAAFFPPSGKKLPWQISVIRDTFLGPLLVQGLNLFSRGLASSCVVKRLPPQTRAAYLSPYDSWAHRLAVLRFIQDIPVRQSDPSYALVREIEAGLARLAEVPALLCWGMRDFVFDADYLAGWQRRFPRAETHRFEDAHHLVMEDAGERIVPLVKRFLGSGEE